MTFKSYILLNESFKDAKAKWVKAGAKPEDVDRVIEKFKELKTAHFLSNMAGGSKEMEDIGWWMRGSWLNFRVDIGEAYDKYQEKLNDKVAGKERAKKSIKVFSNDYVDIYVPMTYEAGCKLARGNANWCIVSSDGDGYWYDYMHDKKQGGLTPYFIIFKDIRDPKLRDMNEPDMHHTVVMVDLNGKISTVWNAENEEIYQQDEDDIKTVFKRFNIPYTKFKSFAVKKNDKKFGVIYKLEPKPL